MTSSDERLATVAAIVWALRHDCLPEHVARQIPAEIVLYLRRALAGDLEAIEALRGWLESRGERTVWH